MAGHTRTGSDRGFSCNAKSEGQMGKFMRLKSSTLKKTTGDINVILNIISLLIFFSTYTVNHYYLKIIRGVVSR